MSALESSSDITSTSSDRDAPELANSSCTPLHESSSQHTTDTSSHSSLGASLQDDVTPTSPTQFKHSGQFQTSGEYTSVASTKSKSKRTSVTSVTNTATQGQLILHGRPEGTPERSQKEQKKRLREYDKMVEASRKRDLKRSISELQIHEERDKEKTELQKFWFEQILPQWSEKVIHSKRVQEAWWRGLPPRVREKVWKRCVANDLNITEDLYGIFLEHAKKKLQIHDSMYSQRVESDADTNTDLLLQTLKGREDTLDAIRYDVSRTFPTLAIFDDNGPFYEPLHNLLGAYTCFRPDIGYVQGMSYIAAILILNLDEYDAFVCLANLLNRPLLQTFYRFDEKRMDMFFRGFDKLVAQILPNIANHLDRIEIKSNYYLLDWLFTLFCKPFDIEVACRIWDVYFRDGEQFIYRTALGILRMIGDELLTCKEFIDVAQLLSKMSPKYNNLEVLFENISKINISLKQVEQAMVSADKEYENPDI